MFKGMETVVYYVQDLKAAAQWYKKVLGITPNYEADYYVGFTVGNHELGLHPAENGATPGAGGQTVYWSVENIEAAVSHLVEAGAKVHQNVTEVGGGIKVAGLLDPFGNVFGVIQNPHSPNR